MKTTRRFLVVSAAGLVLGLCLQAQTPVRAADQATTDPSSKTNGAEYKWSGKVVDSAGQPVEGASLTYWSSGKPGFLSEGLELKKQFTTKADGTFELQVLRASGLLVAQKPGLAPAWRQWNQQFERDPESAETLVLSPPAGLAGMVLDEATNPVANAAVSVPIAVGAVSDDQARGVPNYLTGKPSHDCFSARTDQAGRFRIENFPTNATAALVVRVSGKALRRSAEGFNGFDSLPYHGGQEDIRLIVEPTGVIKGRIGVEGSSQPVAAARITLHPDGIGSFGMLDALEPAQSGTNGEFSLTEVPAGSYRIQAAFGTNAVPEWVAATVRVSVESGQITRDAEMKATHGGLLEVAVLGKNDRKPVERASVSAYGGKAQSTGKSDTNGLVLLRLIPGDYQITASRESMSMNRASASVELDKTNRVEIEIKPPQKITGTVRQPDGHEAAGVLVQVVAGGGAEGRKASTDAAGKFDLEWAQQQYGQSDMVPCLLARDPERNLAVARDIEEDAGPQDLKLEPGITLTGRVECDGKPVTNVNASLIFWTGRSGMHLSGLSRGTNVPGRFEIPALPPGRKYGLVVSAPGCGQKSLYDVGASADAGRVEIDPVELPPANLKLAGQVLDADEKPVAGTYVSLSGEGQANANVRTDREGRFRFEHVCEGSASLWANQGDSQGNTTAEGGDTNVVLRLGHSENSSPDSTPHKLKGTVLNAEGKPTAGVQVAVFPSQGTHWTRTGTNGDFNLTWSLQPWQRQSGGALLVVRDLAHDLAAIEELAEETTNLNVKLKPALSVTGVVRQPEDSPLSGAQVGIWLKAGNSYDQLNEQMETADTRGQYEIKCLPPEGQYMIFASAKGYGRSEQNVQNESETNRLELPPFVLKLADRIVAGQVLNANDKPVSGAHVSLQGEGQPSESMTTDSKGRFHFKVCEGQVRLFANGLQGGYAQGSAEAGETNVIMTISSSSGAMRQVKARTALKGNPLPDLAGVNLASDSAPGAQPILLCLFDAGQRPSRNLTRKLNEQAPALREQHITVLGVQAAVVTDETFDGWKSASPVSFSVGRVVEKSEKCKWASAVPALPWLILTDANRRVVAEGFSLEELDDQIKKLSK